MDYAHWRSGSWGCSIQSRFVQTPIARPGPDLHYCSQMALQLTLFRLVSSYGDYCRCTLVHTSSFFYAYTRVYFPRKIYIQVYCTTIPGTQRMPQFSLSLHPWRRDNGIWELSRSPYCSMSCVTALTALGLATPGPG